MPEEEKQVNQVTTEVREIIARLENTPPNTLEELGGVLAEITEQVEKLSIGPPRRVRVYNVRHLRFLNRIWFDIVIQWVFFSDMITNPVRTSVLNADTKKRVITVEHY